MPEKDLKLYNWNAELTEDESGNEEVEISFRIQGINKSNVFVTAFQAGKQIIETIEGEGSFGDYLSILMNLILVVRGALKKSK